MALKNTKIAREITQTCNRLLSSKSDITQSHKASELSENLQENPREFRYDVSRTTRSAALPKMSLVTREPEQLDFLEMHHLQPATYPKYIKICPNKRDDDVWKMHQVTENRKFSIHYPTSKEERGPHRTSLVTETFKRNLSRGTMCIVGERSYSSSPFLLVSRRYSARKRGEEEKCKPKKKCADTGPCPRMGLPNCDKSKGSHCEHYYIDPKCKKKMAPYPSYSETCAQDLEDDPSECFQCPWNKCGGTDAIKPPKRHYHTSVAPRYVAVIPGLVGFTLPRLCDAKKKPCKAPPPKCQVKKKDDKCPGAEKQKKRKCDGAWSQAYALWAAKENVVPDATWLTLDVVKEARKGTDFPFDKRHADYEYVRKKRCGTGETGCKKKKFKRVPEGCVDPDEKVCMSGPGRIVEHELGKKCPQTTPKCPTKEKPKCPNKDKSINIILELAKEHDKGQPPPCPEKVKESEKCPKEKPQLPYKRERDLRDPFYRKNPKPYPPVTER